jgi:hypothetical protein
VVATHNRRQASFPLRTGLRSAPDSSAASAGPPVFDPYAGALPARPPTAKKDLRKLGERMIIMMKRPFAWFRMMCANAKRAAEVGAAVLCVAAFAVEAAISLVNLFA